MALALMLAWDVVDERWLNSSKIRSKNDKTSGISDRIRLSTTNKAFCIERKDHTTLSEYYWPRQLG